jgi:hypothetical protein
VVEQVRVAAQVGFLTLHNTPIPVSDIAEVLAYRSFSHYRGAKAAVDMARTGSNRGWGRLMNRCKPRLQTDFRFRV